MHTLASADRIDELFGDVPRKRKIVTVPSPSHCLADLATTAMIEVLPDPDVP